MAKVSTPDFFYLYGIEDTMLLNLRQLKLRYCMQLIDTCYFTMHALVRL